MNVMSVASSHLLVSILVSVKRYIQMGRLIFPNSFYYLLRFQAVGQQRVVWVIILKPLHNSISLWVENKLSSFQSYCSVSRYALTFHHIFDVRKRKMFYWLLPNGAMLATRLASRGSIYHQRTQLLMLRTDDVIEE